MFPGLGKAGKPESEYQENLRMLNKWIIMIRIEVHQWRRCHFMGKVLVILVNYTQSTQ
jgi:hypothetical protein